MKKVLAIILCLVMVLGIFTAVPFSASAEDTDETESSETVAENPDDKDLAESAKSDDLAEVGAQEKAMFILKNLNISQGVNGQYSHEGTKAIDCAEAKGVSAYAPFTGTIKKIYTADANVVWLESNSQVLFADGTVDYMTIMVEHDNDVSDLYVGKVIRQGERFYEAGDNGWVTGPHIHLECGRGKFVSGGWYKNSYGRWMIYNAVNPYDALYLSESTNVIEGYGYNWRRTNVTPNPSNPWIKASKTSIPTGSSITFTFGADNATGYTIGIDKNGSRMITEGVSSGKSYTFNDEGNYSAYVTCYNSAGSVDSSRVSFSVFAPVILGNDFVATITNSKGGMNVGANSEGNVELQTKSDSDNQKWQFIRQSDNSYKIINIGRNQCLDVANFGTANGTNIGLCPSNDTNAQRYYIRDNGYGYGIVPKVNTGAALDISGGSLTNGANIQEYTWNGSNAQIFSIDYVGLEPSVTKEYNGHTYEYYNLSMPWNQAYRFCESKGGHLVTITEQAENEFVRDMISESVWIGMTCYNNNKSWYWVTGEDFSYNNFVSGQPDYYNGIEFFGEMYYGNGYDGQWNDHSLNNPIPFVCEYDNGDVNADSYTPVYTETIDGITYDVFDNCVDWLTAEAICEAKGGQLVKIDSAEKNAIVNQLANKGSKPEYWINVTDRFSEGSWSDNDGAPLSYTNWADGEPTNDLNAEEFAVLYKSSGQWIDIKGFCPVYRNSGFICESRVPLGIALNKEDISIEKGKTYQLRATVTPDGVDKTVSWKSGNTKVATVTSSGVVRGISDGYTTITATTVNGLKSSCIVIVWSGSVSYMVGDSDDDNVVSVIDATTIQKKLASISVAKYIEPAADVDEDSKVTILDATQIQKHLAHLAAPSAIGTRKTTSGTPARLSGWTSWSTKAPSGADVVVTESRTEYRYKDLKFIKATDQPATPDGYTATSIEDAGYTEWGAWSGWSTERQSASSTKEEGTTTGYRYYTFVCPNCGQRDPYNIPSGNGNCSNCGYTASMPWAVIYYEAIGSNAPGNTYYDQYRNYAIINGQRWYYEKPGTDNGAGGTGQPTTTMYRYRTRNKLYNYGFTPNSFSAWQTEAVEASDSRQVETRTVYRYRYIIR